LVETQQWAVTGSSLLLVEILAESDGVATEYPHHSCYNNAQMADVFISYQRGEREAVSIVSRKLGELQLDVWFDSKLRPGGTFDEEIAEQLRSARAVLTCWTPAAIASEWVRAEATYAHQEGKLVACFLEPAKLIPPFNLTHTEDLSTWAGQDDAPAWVKLLERIGQLTGRPGVASYFSLFAPTTTVATLRTWVMANGSDALAAGVWDRIALLEGEGAAERIAREKEEARERDRHRKAQEGKSRALARERGIRSGRSLPVRFVVATTAVLLIILLGVGYILDSQRRERSLNEADSAAAVRAFLAKNRWHPIAASARQKLARFDEAAWEQTRTMPTMDALNAYLTGFPGGAHQREAEMAKASAERVREAQSLLARAGRYSGPAHGALDAVTANSIKSFQYERGMVVTGGADDALISRLKSEVERLIHVKPDELVAKRIGPPTIEEYRDIAARLSVDAPTLAAIRVVESAGRAFDSTGHPVVLFERHLFSRLTEHRFDASNPDISALAPGGYGALNAQWDRLRKAYALDPEAAYKATSFGMFQIIGMQHKTVGFETAAEYARFVSQSEANQVEVFARFVERRRALKPLQCLDWDGFAGRWNGPGSIRNEYAARLRTAYIKAAEDFGSDPSPPQRPGCQ
jgi:hypothetical protein